MISDKMIEQNSIEWKMLIRKLVLSNEKSNRDSMCIKCWKILTYDQMNLHRQTHKDHASSIITSKYFNSESKFLALA